MKYLIINEKPDQAKSFSKALGGMSGTFEGNSYRIEPLHGHIMQLKAPQYQINDESWEADVSNWSDVSRIPWNLSKFTWKKEPKPKPKGSKFKSDKQRVSELRQLAKSFDAIVIATDDDPSGEGDLLAQEVIDELNFKGKLLRCLFADDTKKSIVKGMSNLVDVTDSSSNVKLQMAIARERFDFGTMQLSRLATKFARENQCNVTIRPGRLKSYIGVLVYEQIYARETFVIHDLFRPVFIDDAGNKFTDSKIEKAKNRDVAELNMQQLKQSEVVVSGTQRKTTAPPKLMTYDQVHTAANSVSKKTIRNKVFMDTYQKMYDQNILSYPRTTDSKVTKDQWDEMMPLVDDIARIVGVDPTLLTHREPRKNYVSSKPMSHGANRPGLVLPQSLDSLTKYGEFAPLIYKTLALSFLSTMCDDYEYDVTTAFVKDFPTFTASKSVPAKPGYKALLGQFEDVDDEEKDEDDSHIASFGKIARPEIETSKSKKPQAPTQKWVFSNLERYNIGTGATRVSTMAELLEGKKQILTQKGRQLWMTEEGFATGAILKGTLLSTAKVTKQLHDLCESVGKGDMTMQNAYDIVDYIIEKDTPIMKRNASQLYTDSYLIDKLPEKKNNTSEKWRGIYAPTGDEIAFGKKQMGSEVTLEQSQDLLDGKTIPFTVTKKDGGTSRAMVFLEQKSFKDAKTKKKVTYWGVTVKKWL